MSAASKLGSYLNKKSILGRVFNGNFKIDQQQIYLFDKVKADEKINQINVNYTLLALGDSIGTIKIRFVYKNWIYTGYDQISSHLEDKFVDKNKTLDSKT